MKGYAVDHGHKPLATVAFFAGLWLLGCWLWIPGLLGIGVQMGQMSVSWDSAAVAQEMADGTISADLNHFDVGAVCRQAVPFLLRMVLVPPASIRIVNAEDPSEASTFTCP